MRHSFIVNPTSFRVFTVYWDVGCVENYGETMQTPDEEEDPFVLHGPTSTRRFGWVAPLCSSAKVESSSSTGGVTETFGVHLTPSTPLTVQDGPRDVSELQSTMGDGSSRNATVLASERQRAVPIDCGGRVVEIRLGPTHQTQDEMLKAFKSITAEGHRPQTLQTDKGKEFYQATIQCWLKKEGICHFSTLGDAKASIVEWFNRALKSRLY